MFELDMFFGVFQKSQSAVDTWGKSDIGAIKQQGM
jgi:hypothetical protein